MTSPPNPFAPPRSEVADSVEQVNGRPVVRPRTVNFAFGMLVLSLAVGALNYLSHAAKDSNAIAISTLGITAGLAFAIRAGMNWARVLTLILFLLGLPSLLAAPMLAKQFGQSFFAVLACQTLLQAVALWLLFRKPGSLWFKAKSKQAA